jgi:hypothetical protein
VYRVRGSHLTDLGGGGRRAYPETIYLSPTPEYNIYMPRHPVLVLSMEAIMAQTVLTHSELIHLIQWKLNGFVQLDLFPEELEQAKREQDYAVWADLINREEGETK